MSYSLKSKKKIKFCTCRYLFILLSNNLFLFVLLFTFSFLFISFLDDNDNPALAFKPTVPSDQGNQQQEQEYHPTSSKQISEKYVSLKKWGSEGNGTGQFYLPQGIAVDSSDNVYVADIKNDRIQKFDSDGNFITQWGSFGNGTGQFASRVHIAINLADNVYVSDYGNHHIQVFALSFTWGSYYKFDKTPIFF